MSPSPLMPPLSHSAASIVEEYVQTPNRMLAIPLSYEYTLATLSPEFFKGVDAYVYSALSQMASLDLRLQFVLGFHKTKVILRSMTTSKCSRECIPMVMW